MSIFQDLANRYIYKPIADKMLDKVRTDSTDTPSVFSIPTGFNTQPNDSNRRQVGGVVDYRILRNMARNHETVRAAINARKRQITQLEWDIVDAYPDQNASYSKDELNALKFNFKDIGGPNVRFRELLDKMIEDILVLDALAVYKQKTVGGKLLRLVPIDGATIKLRVDDAGMTPLPPEIAYEQWIKGHKEAEMTTDELIYDCMNPRTETPYGLSPLESLIMTVDSSLRAGLYNLNYLSDNNVPQGFLSLPESWTPSQIKEYKEYFDAMISGPRDQAKVFPIPGGASYQATSKPTDFKFKDFFDYLDRKIAMVFDVTPQELGLSLLQYKENADSQEKIQMRKGLKPLAHFLEEIFTNVLQIDMGYPDLVFKFTGMESRFSVADSDLLVRNGIISVDEVRSDMGLEALGVSNFIVTTGGALFLKDIQNQQTTVSGTNSTNQSNEQSQVPSAKIDDLEAQMMKLWEQKALNDIKKKGIVYRKFESQYITGSTRETLEKRLSDARSAEDVKRVFKMIKAKKNPLDAIEKTKKYTQYRNAIKNALIEQVKSVFKFDNPDMQKFEFKLPKLNISSLSDMLKWAFNYGGDTALNSVGLNMTFDPDARFAEKLGDRTNYIIDSVNSTTKDWIVNKISTGKEQGLTNDEISRQIAEEYPDIAQSRADMIVRTEVANAVQQGEITAYQDQGIKQKMWVTSEDDMVDPDCADLDGKIVNVDESFGEVDAPPLHPNCRCYIQAVIE